MSDGQSKTSEPVTVSSLLLNPAQWTLEEQNPNENVFVSKDGDIVGIELRTEATLFQVDFDDLSGLRSNIRIGFGGAGLISADIDEFGSKPVKGVSIITKLPQIPSGRSYNGLIFLPFKDFSYSLYMRYEEAGVTGLREAALVEVLLKEGEVQLLDPVVPGMPPGMQGFEEDLYDAKLRGPLVRNKSEREKYDAQFPLHPLTKLRACMERVKNGLIFDTAVLASEQ